MACPPTLGPTLAACLLVAAGFVASVAGATGGLSHWTLEAMRRASAREGTLRASPATLRGADGRPVAFAPPGRVQVVDFIYTRCPTVCLSLGTAFQQMQQTLRNMPGAPPVTLLSVSFDVAHDDEAALGAYAERHRGAPAFWLVAVPPSAAAARALLSELGVVAIDDGTGGFVHNASLHVIDAQGRVRSIRDHADWRLALAEAIELAGTR